MEKKYGPSSIEWGAGRSLDFSAGTLVMGIINCTPDSFYAGSRRKTTSAAIDAAREMIAQGADIIDIGGESTRPGSTFVDTQEETARVIPVIEAVREESGVVISVDTRKAAVAEEALDAGADIVNDISALRDDPQLANVVASRGVPVILMHMLGTPKTMQKSPSYDSVVSEILAWLTERIRFAESRGITLDKIILDPGIGFGKRLEDNLQVIKEVSAFCRLGYPVLLGMSRKSFISGVLDVPPEDRLSASLAAAAYCVGQGAQILRVHDVRETVHLVRILAAIGNA